MPLMAITREVSPTIGKCELTHLKRQVIDVGLAQAQHRLYEKALIELGCRLHSLPASPDLSDSVFVEDTAVVLDKVAIITRPGARSRRPEIDAVARVLRAYRKLVYIRKPGTMDGGDVLCVGKRLYIGLSSRTNQAAIDQVEALLAPFDYTVKTVKVRGCLHLKSAATLVKDDTLLINPEWVDRNEFRNLNFIDIDSSEALAANALLVGERVIYRSSFPRTRAKLEEHGRRLEIIDISELAKAEGAVTCCSLIFRI